MKPTFSKILFTDLPGVGKITLVKKAIARMSSNHVAEVH